MFKNDTIRLIVQFRTFDGNKVTPDDVKLTIYDKQENVIQEITYGLSTDGLGKYEYDYTDSTGKDFIFEYSGFFNEKRILARESVNVKFN
ncbi:hypothetical protein PGC35_15740 [Psychrobacillus sp. PGGUH221]|uniref:hypothetical protein n=1 Tax=Psychrobacillus sp. PGGUH221 TaxID=3020058 RepID=UPI0035C69733